MGGGQNDATGVLRRVPAITLETHGQVNDFMGVLVSIVSVLEFEGCVERLVNSHTRAFRNEPRQPGGITNRLIEAPGHVTNGLLCCQRAKSHDVTDILLAILLGHVLDNLRPAGEFDVRINP